jgi:DNA (cytosine-5)-methyltransferase 1
MIMNKYTYVDLFAGAGGLSLGFGNAGFELEFANDIAKEAVDTFRHNLKTTHENLNQNRLIHGDIIELYEHLGTSKVENMSLGHITVETDKEINLRKKAPAIKDDRDIKSVLADIDSVDVLAGGPPCQGFSMIGRSKRASAEERMRGFVDDPRNQLFRYFLKFAEKLSPKIVLIENVKGLGSAAGYKDLIEESLKNTGKGYAVASEVLNAKDFGLAQHRERMFFIGVRKDFARQHEIDAEMIFNQINDSKEESLKLADIIFDLPKIKANPKPSNYSKVAEICFSNKKSFGMDLSNQSFDELVPKLTSYAKRINTYRGNLFTPSHLFNHKSRYHNERDLFIYKNLKEGKYLNDPENKKALSKVTYGVTIDENGNKSVKGFGDKYFKLDSKSVSKTIIAHLETDGNSYVHPGDNPRSITPREAARIQSFPDWYRFCGNTRNQLKQIGNAVPPMLAFNIASVFKQILNDIDSKSEN